MVAINYLKKIIYRFLILPLLRKQYKKIGFGSRIIKPMLITPKFISLGNHVRIRNGSRIEGVNKYLSLCFNPSIVLDDFVCIEQNIHLTCAESVFIGKNTAIAANVTITDIHHPYDNIDLPIEKQLIQTTPVFIGEDCKIYNNAVILPGTRIGKHCTIGANSVVSGTFPDFSVIVGAPAKIIKRYSFEQQVWLKTDAKGNFIEI